MTKVEKAMELRLKKKYNCSQCVFCAYAEDMGLDEMTAFKLIEGVGGGMGGQGKICGALTAAILVLSYMKSSGETSGKATTYKAVRSLTAGFMDRTGAANCAEIKGLDTGIVLRPCNDCIVDAIEALEEELEK